MAFNQILDPNNYTPENVNKTVNKTISNVQSGTTLKSLAQPNMSVNTQNQSIAPAMSVAPKATNPANMTINPQTSTPVANTPVSTPPAPTTPVKTLTATQKAQLDSAYFRTGGQTTIDKTNIDYAIKNLGYIPPSLATTSAVDQAKTDADKGFITSEPATKYFDQLISENTKDAERFTLGADELKKMQDEARAGGLNVDQYAARSTTNSKATMYSDIPEIAALDAEYEAENRRYEEYMAKAEAQNKQMIQMIRDNYSRQREEQKVANQNRLKAQEILGTRSGRQRYAPEIQGGLMSAEEKAGLTRLSDLQKEEEQLVLAAQQAHDAKAFEMLGEVFALKQAKRKEQNQLIQQMYENSLKSEEVSIKKMNAEKDAKKGLIEDLDFFAKSGMSLDDASGEFIDNMLGYGKGASQAYVEAQKSTNQIEKAGKMFDFLGKVPSDQMVTLPDGSKVSGLKEIDYTKNTFRTTETDMYGNVTDVFVTRNPSSGKFEISDTISYGQIGKSTGPSSWQEYQLAGGEATGTSYLDYLKGTTGTGDLSDKDVKNIDSSPQAKKINTLADLLSKAQTYQSLIETSGTEIMGKSAAALDSAYAALKISWKEAANLGALTGPDVAIIEESIKKASGIEGKKNLALFGLDGIKKSVGDVVNRVKQDGQLQYNQLIKRNPRYEESDYVKSLASPFISTPSNFENVDSWVNSNPNINKKILIDEIIPFIESQGINDPTDAEILETIEYLQGFNKPLSMGKKGSGTPDKPLVIASSPIDPKTKKDIECVIYSRQFNPSLPPMLGKKEKKAGINSYTPLAGSVAIMPSIGKYGHTANVLSTNRDGTITIEEANFKDGKITRRTGTPKELKIEGYFSSNKNNIG